jgi:hypothetical protein
MVPIWIRGKICYPEREFAASQKRKLLSLEFDFAGQAPILQRLKSPKGKKSLF